MNPFCKPETNGAPITPLFIALKPIRDLTVAPEKGLIRLMKITKFLSALGLGVTVAGCASVDSHFVNPQVESPVVRGQAGLVGIGFGAVPGHTYEFTSDGSQRPPDLTDPDIENFTSLFVDGTYVARERLQLGLEIHPTNVGAEPKIRWQAVGDGAQGFQFSLFGRGGYTFTTEKGDQSGEFGPGGYDWDASSQGFSGSAGFSAGYFLKDGILIYLGSAYGVTSAKANIDHKLSDNGTSPAANYKVDDQGKLWSVGVGLELQFRTAILLGLTYTEIDYDKLPVDYTTQYTIGLGF